MEQSRILITGVLVANLLSIVHFADEMHILMLSFVFVCFLQVVCFILSEGTAALQF